MPPIPRIGTEFAGYRIEALLGRGGMGVVYRAEHPRLGMRIALKVLVPELADDEAFRERFVRESRLAASITHPHIVTIYDAGEWTGSLYIAMRYIAGGDLKALLRREGTLPAGQTLSLVEQIAGALDAAHARGLIHRDVKPANILLDEGAGPGSSNLAYLSDFGVVKRSQSSVSPSVTGDLLGTIDYIAPEQIEGKQVDGRADLYSLGCLLFECLTGRVPFERESEAAVLWGHMREEPPSPSAFRAELPPEVDEVVAKALAKSPGDRFPTGAALAADLGQAIGANAGERETLVLQPDVEPRIGQASPTRRSKLAVAGGLLVALALGAGLATLAFLATEGGGETTVAQTVTRAVTVEVPAASRLSAREQDLLRHVPADIGEACRSVAPPSSDFDASLACRPPGTTLRAQYNHARSSERLGDYFIARVARAGVPIPEPGGRVRATGSCSSGERAVNDWIQFDLAGHEEADALTPRSLIRGRIVCFRRDRRSWIEWTHPRLLVYAFASAPEFEPLYDWWAQEAGPL